MSERADSPWRGVPLFLFIAFGFSWALAIGARTAWGTQAAISLAIVYMAGPSIAALTCALIYDRGRVFASWGLRSNPFNIWLLWAFLFPVVFAAAAFGLTLLLSDRTMLAPAEGLERALREAGRDPDDLPLPMDVLAMIQFGLAPFLGALINTPIMILTEELGWRGWLWDRWSKLGFWRNAVLTGFVWGVWHTPLIVYGHNYPNMPVTGPILFTVWTILFSVVLHHIRERGGSLVHAAMVHGTLNGVAGATIILLSDPTMPWRGAVGAGGFIALAVGVAVVWFLRRGIKPVEPADTFE